MVALVHAGCVTASDPRFITLNESFNAQCKHEGLTGHPRPPGAGPDPLEWSWSRDPAGLGGTPSDDEGMTKRRTLLKGVPGGGPPGSAGSLGGVLGVSAGDLVQVGATPGPW